MCAWCACTGRAQTFRIREHAFYHPPAPSEAPHPALSTRKSPGSREPPASRRAVPYCIVLWEIEGNGGKKGGRKGGKKRRRRRRGRRGGRKGETSKCSKRKIPRPSANPLRFHRFYTSIRPPRSPVQLTVGRTGTVFSTLWRIFRGKAQKREEKNKNGYSNTYNVIVRAYIHAYIHTYIHTCVHTHRHTN